MLNRITLIGNLGRDPELTYTQSGTAVARFSIAVSRRWTEKASGERKEETTWFTVVAFDRQAEVCNQYLHKGSRIYLEGRMQSRKYTDRDNNERTAWEVVLTDMQMLDARSGQDTGHETGHETTAAAGADASEENPF